MTERNEYQREYMARKRAAARACWNCEGKPATALERRGVYVNLCGRCEGALRRTANVKPATTKGE